MNRQTALIKESLWLALASLWCLAILALRMEWAGKLMFLFLAWNLFLAWIPWIISAFAIPRFSWANPAKWVLGGVWLLFLPNAPYILTDLVHLRQRATIPFWLDLLLILSFAFTALMLGIASLRHIWQEVKVIPRLRQLLLPAVCVLSAFGVYVGRYLRWNSWDVVTQPHTLLSDLLAWAYHPATLKEPLAFSLGFGMLLWLLFWLPQFLGKEVNGEHVVEGK